MRIAIIAFGTRGDVQPIVALGKALKASGHHVRVIAGSDFKAWIEGHGLQAVAAGIDVHALMTGDGGNEWIEHGHEPCKELRTLKGLFERHGLTMMRDAWGACQSAEVIVSSLTSEIYADSIADKLSARHICTPLQPAPLASRSGLVYAGAPRRTRAGFINYLLGKWLVEPFGWRLMGAITNRFRRETLGLPPQTFRESQRRLRRVLVVQGFSPHVVPHLADWPANVHTAGFWFLDEAKTWQPPPALQAFRNRLLILPMASLTITGGRKRP